MSESRAIPITKATIPIGVVLIVFMVLLCVVSICYGGNRPNPKTYSFQLQDRPFDQALKDLSLMSGYKIDIKDNMDLDLNDQRVTIRLDDISMSYGLRRVLFSAGVTSCAIVVNDKINTITIFILDYDGKKGKLSSDKSRNQVVRVIEDTRPAQHPPIPVSLIKVPSIAPGERPLTQEDLDRAEQRAQMNMNATQAPDLAPPK